MRGASQGQHAAHRDCVQGRLVAGGAAGGMSSHRRSPSRTGRAGGRACGYARSTGVASPLPRDQVGEGAQAVAPLAGPHGDAGRALEGIDAGESPTEPVEKLPRRHLLAATDDGLGREEREEVGRRSIERLDPRPEARQPREQRPQVAGPRSSPRWADIAPAARRRGCHSAALPGSPSPHRRSPRHHPPRRRRATLLSRSVERAGIQPPRAGCHSWAQPSRRVSSVAGVSPKPTTTVSTWIARVRVRSTRPVRSIGATIASLTSSRPRASITVHPHRSGIPARASPSRYARPRRSSARNHGEPRQSHPGPPARRRLEDFDDGRPGPTERVGDDEKERTGAGDDHAMTGQHALALEEVLHPARGDHAGQRPARERGRRDRWRRPRR